MLFCSAGVLLIIDEFTAADDDEVVAAKAAASEEVMRMTVRVTIVRRGKTKLEDFLYPLTLSRPMLNRRVALGKTGP